MNNNQIGSLRMGEKRRPINNRTEKERLEKLERYDRLIESVSEEIRNHKKTITGLSNLMEHLRSSRRDLL